MIGDDLVNDVGGAQRCGIRGVQVRTGKYRLVNVPSSRSRALLKSIYDIGNDSTLKIVMTVYPFEIKSDNTVWDKSKNVFNFLSGGGALVPY